MFRRKRNLKLLDIILSILYNVKYKEQIDRLLKEFLDKTFNADVTI